MTMRSQKLCYEIKVKGELDSVWTEWFAGLDLTHDCDGNTVLTGEIVDHTALHSILLKIRDLNLKLISVNEIKFNGDERSSFDKEKETFK